MKFLKWFIEPRKGRENLDINLYMAVAWAHAMGASFAVVADLFLNGFVATAGFLTFIPLYCFGISMRFVIEGAGETKSSENYGKRTKRG